MTVATAGVLLTIAITSLLVAFVSPYVFAAAFAAVFLAVLLHLIPQTRSLALIPLDLVPFSLGARQGFMVGYGWKAMLAGTVLLLFAFTLVGGPFAVFGSTATFRRVGRAVLGSVVPLTLGFVYGYMWLAQTGLMRSRISRHLPPFQEIVWPRVAVGAAALAAFLAWLLGRYLLNRRNP